LFSITDTVIDGHLFVGKKENIWKSICWGIIERN